MRRTARTAGVAGRRGVAAAGIALAVGQELALATPALGLSAGGGVACAGTRAAVASRIPPRDATDAPYRLRRGVGELLLQLRDARKQLQPNGTTAWAHEETEERASTRCARSRAHRTRPTTAVSARAAVRFACTQHFFFLESTFIDQINPKRQTAGPHEGGSPELDLEARYSGTRLGAHYPLLSQQLDVARN